MRGSVNELTPTCRAAPMMGLADAAELAAQIKGLVLLPGDEGYDVECAGFDLSVAAKPEVAAGVWGVEDIQATVSFAYRHGLPVAVLTTGHGAATNADGAVLINTRRLDGVTIDRETRTAWVEAGVRGQQVIEAAAAVGLAPLTGSAPGVGVVGYTLGGGIGPLSRAHGFASDRVVSIDLVTADGELRQVTPASEPDLFWALRGGKGNFGVVTAMEFGLVPVSRLYGGSLFFAGELSAEVLHAWREWTASVPEEMTSSVALLRQPPSPAVPEPMRGRLVVHVRVAYLGSAIDGERLVDPLRAIGPLIDTVVEMPFTAVGSIYQEPSGPLPVHSRSMLLRELTAEAVDALVEFGGPTAAYPLPLVEVLHLGGALARPADQPSAIAFRDAEFGMRATGVGGPEQAEAIVAHADRLVDRLLPWGLDRQNINFLTPGDASSQSVRKAYGPETYRRLASVKTRYDPENTFRINHNVAPG